MQFGPRARLRAFPQLLPASRARNPLGRSGRGYANRDRSILSHSRWISIGPQPRFIAMFSARHRNRVPTLKRKRFSQPVFQGGILARWRKYNTARHEC